MNELIEYFNKIEARLHALEQAGVASAEDTAREAEQEAKLAALTTQVSTLLAKISELEQQLVASQELTAVLETRIDELESRAEMILPEEDEDIDDEPSISESEEVADDEETGLPELEVELEEDTTINESEEVKTDEETGLPELEVEWEEEPETPQVEVKWENKPANGMLPIVEETPAAPVVEPKHVAAPVVTVTPEPAPVAQETAKPSTIADTPKAETAQSIVPKIDDIKKAISLGDRFLFQRELFGGNGELMTKTISELNALKTLGDAENYIAKRFNWDKESNAYELFFNILKRRY